MSCSNQRKSNRPRFKGIENFLRRIAFNLGNTPSQTEVKIISCIPIDVTDLQQKIILLERELEETRKGNMPKAQRTPVTVNTALIAPAPKADSMRCFEESVKDARLSSTTSKNKRSAISFMYPTIDETTEPEFDLSQHDDIAVLSDDKRLHKRGLLKKAKTKLNSIGQNCNMQFVYFAETNTNGSPFYYNDGSKKSHKDSKRKEPLSRTYLEEMVRKQYRPDKLMRELSRSTSFSKPTCHDLPEPPTTIAYDTDACSSCYENYQNIDRTMKAGLDRYIYQQIPVTNTLVHDTGLYDTTLDYVPVKEPSNKQQNYEEYPHKKKPKRPTEHKHSPPPTNPKPHVQPYHYNCCNVMTNRYSKPEKNTKKNRKCRTWQPRRVEPKRRIQGESSNSCVIECGGVYQKNPYYITKVPSKSKPKPAQKDAECFNEVMQKHVECFTINTNDNECQTASSKSVQLEPPELFEPPTKEDKKTEDTLNQIKVILQTVLSEVKSNSQPKSVPEETDKKDAFVQKSSSYSNIDNCSTLIQGYTHSPYNITHQFGPSISRHGNNIFPYNSQYQPQTYGPGRCLQNYPLFIQTTGRQCACCFRSMPNPLDMKQAANTSTNTDSQSQHNKETDKLIKEIYKSLAINMDYLTKYNSENESRTGKVFDYPYTPSQETKTSVSMKSKGNQGSLTTHTHTLTIGSTVLTGSESKLTNKTADSVLKTGNRSGSDSFSKDLKPSSTSDRGEDLKGTTTSSQDTITPDSDDFDSDHTVITSRTSDLKPKKTMRKASPSLFSKVVRLWKSKKSKKADDIRETKELTPPSSSDSDSDSDYETVYSYKAAKKLLPQDKFLNNKKPKFPRRGAPNLNQAKLPPLKARPRYSTYHLHKEYAQDKARRQLATSRYQYMPAEPEPVRPRNQTYELLPEYPSDIPIISGNLPNTARAGFHLQTKGYTHAPRARSPPTRPHRQHVRFNPVNTQVRYPNPNTDNMDFELEGILKNQEQMQSKSKRWLKRPKLGLKSAPQWKNYVDS